MIMIMAFHNNDITMIIMLTATTITKREYFQIEICVTFDSASTNVEIPLQR